MMQAIMSPTWNVMSNQRSAKGSTVRGHKLVTSSPRDSSARQSASSYNIVQKGIQKNFPGKSISKELEQGRIEKAFVQPMHARFGQRFANKSEESRFLKKFDSILKLRHILMTESDLAKNYTH